MTRIDGQVAVFEERDKTALRPFVTVNRANDGHENDSFSSDRTVTVTCAVHDCVPPRDVFFRQTGITSTTVYLGQA